MANKINRLELINWKSVFWISVVILGMSVLLYSVETVPDHIREINSKKFDKQTSGSFIKYKPIERLTQGKMGNKLITEYFDVSYSYKVNNRLYNGIDRVPASKKNYNFMRALNRGNLKNLTIRYNEDEPSSSQIAIPK